jgi:hypothetical protein
MTNPNEVAAQGLQEKFELYLLGLAFTLLGLAIQTAKFEGPPPQRIIELTGWFLLLISGLVGLLRLRHVPVLLRHGAEIQQSENRMFQVQGEPPETPIKYVDETITVADYIEAHKKNIADISAIIKPLSEKIILMGRVQTWSFVAGVCAVAFARAYLPATGIVALWCR